MEPKEKLNHWRLKISNEVKERERYRNQCRMIEKIYSDERRPYNQKTDGYTTSADFNDYEFNILWSNIQTLKAALISQNPKPDVRRRHKDKNAVAKEVAIVTERALEYVEDTTNFEDNLKQIVQNYLIGWPGVGRVKYKPYTSDETKVIPLYKNEAMDGFIGEDGEAFELEEDEEAIFDGEAYSIERTESELLHEEAWIEAIPGAHFHWELTSSWDKTRWCALEHYLDKEQLKVQFPNHWEKIPMGYTDTSYDKEGDVSEETDAQDNPKARIFECFDLDKRSVFVYAEGYDTVLEDEDDPYKLEAFYPFPQPLFPTVAKADGTPTPDYIYYQDQHAQLNTLVQRISTLTEALKYRGLYDAVLKEAVDISALEDGEFDPIVGITERMMADGKTPSLSDFFYTMPLADGAALLNQLHVEVEKTKQQIYEITGISDIVRGTTKASETLGAQQLKAQFSNLRLSNKQKDVERFCRDIFRLLAETISENFEQDTLSEMSGVEVSDEMMTIFTSDLLRTYQINVETDSTVLKDSQEEQRTRTEALNVLTALFEKTMPMIQAGMPKKLVGELVLFGLRGFKGGRELEGIVQEMVDEAYDDATPVQGERVDGAPTGAPAAVPDITRLMPPVVNA